MPECPGLPKQDLKKPMSRTAAPPAEEVPPAITSGCSGQNSERVSHVLAGERRGSFWALIVTQFQGAFSLNVLRYLLTFMVMGTALAHSHSDTLVSLVTLLFFVPLVLFSMAGGFLAD